MFLEPNPAPLDLSEALAMEANVDWSEAFGHKTVLGPEAVHFLGVERGGIFVDGTLGGGGHSRLILEKLPKGRLIALDQDADARTWAQEGWGKSKEQLTVVGGNFGDLDQILSGLGVEKVDGILLDLGLSSRQLAQVGRGFSWNIDEPLDMRLNPEGPLSAFEVVNKYPEKELADLIWQYGEERASRRLARKIVEARGKKPIETTWELSGIIVKALYRPGPPPRIHPATRTFMALRIEVNQELAVLKRFLGFAPEILAPGGRLVIISFHSLEDRLVKRAFKDKEGGYSPWRECFKKPLISGEMELAQNPRARSAKMRAAERI